jgi:hypothetical protein
MTETHLATKEVLFQNIPAQQHQTDAAKLPVQLPRVTLPVQLPRVTLPVQLPRVTLPVQLPRVTLPVQLPRVTFLRLFKRNLIETSHTQ